MRFVSELLHPVKSLHFKLAAGGGGFSGGSDSTLGVALTFSRVLLKTDSYEFLF